MRGLGMLSLSIFITASLLLSFSPQVEAQSGGTRCTTSGQTLFLHFNYQPVPNSTYPENKAVIYIPKEAQCAGEFPLYIHFHGDNKYSDGISPFYLPPSEIVHYTETRRDGTTTIHEQHGSSRFQRAIEAAMHNARVPGMIFVLPANAHPTSNWTGMTGTSIKTAVQAALASNSATSGLNIRLSNDTIISGHSGAGCHGDDSALIKARDLNPKAVGVIDTCTSIYPQISTTYPRATILYYAADMAYTGASFANNQESGGYHNVLPAGFQNLASCDAQIFFTPHNPQVRQRDSTPHYGTQNTHFKQYWDNPQLPCAKHSSNPWYALFATEIDHATAAGLGVQTLLSLVYSENTPQQTSGTATTGSNFVPTQGSAGTQTNTAGGVRVSAPVAGGTVPLEVGINGITSIEGNNQGYIVNYTRILFLYAAGIAGSLALLVLIGAGLIIILGGKSDQAKQLIIGSISGLALLATSGWILYLINPCFFTFSANPVCTPRGPAAVRFQFAPGTNGTPLNSQFNLNGTPPGAPQRQCNNGVCDIILPVEFIAQGSAPRECEFDNICAQNPNAGTDTAGENRKWGGVSCGVTSFAIAYRYVSGNTTAVRDILRDMINNYYRCGIHGSNDRSSIGGYDAVSAPRTFDDILCAYVLGTGGNPSKLTNILRTQLNAHGSHSVQLTPETIFRELSEGHPMVVGGAISRARNSGFVSHAHFTVVVGIQGYNESTKQFTNLLIHDVAHNGGDNSIMTWDNFTSLQSSNHYKTGYAVAM